MDQPEEASRSRSGAVGEGRASVGRTNQAVNAPFVWLMGGYAMAGDKGAALASRSRSAPRVVAPRNKVNVALPLGRITVGEPVKMAVGDWISLAGLVASVAGFSVVIWQLIRSTRASEAD
jgi:hypothetical protein